MKIRIYKRLIDKIFHVIVHTEDWSEADRLLMLKYGEPEINLGGTLYCGPNHYVGVSSGDYSEDSSSSSLVKEITIDDAYARVMTESPFIEKFDIRDFGFEDAKILATEWGHMIEDRIIDAVKSLREKGDFFATEEITEY